MTLERALAALVASEPQSPRTLASACGCSVAEILAILDRAITSVERCPPPDGCGETCWWWQMTPEEAMRQGKPRRRQRRRGSPDDSRAARADAAAAWPAPLDDQPASDAPGDHQADGRDAPGGADRPAAGGVEARPGTADVPEAASPANLAAAPAPTVLDRALRLLERRHQQGMGGAPIAWLCSHLGVRWQYLSPCLLRDDRFGRLSAGADVWWWSASILAERGLRP